MMHVCYVDDETGEVRMLGEPVQGVTELKAFEPKLGLPQWLAIGGVWVIAVVELVELGRWLWP